MDWLEISKAAPIALRFAARHYSAQKGGHEIGPPGQKIVLLTPDQKALWGSHRPAPWSGIKRMDGFDGHSCFIFRNESSSYLSSELVKQAVAYTAQKWGDAAFITYVGRDHVASSNPGYCFLIAGFEHDKWVWSSKLGMLRVLTMPYTTVASLREQAKSGPTTQVFDCLAVDTRGN